MSIPDLLPSGLLPEGIHECDLRDIEAKFTYNECRREIWRGFDFIKQGLLAIPEIEVIYIDGSFVSDKDTPRDVDIAIEFVNIGAYYQITDKHKYLILERDKIKLEHRVDIWRGFIHCTKDIINYINWFQGIDKIEARKRQLPLNTKKGVLKVRLR